VPVSVQQVLPTWISVGAVQCVQVKQLSGMLDELIAQRVSGRVIDEIATAATEDDHSVRPADHLAGYARNPRGIPRRVARRRVVKLVTDDEGDIRKTLFFDNVRDFQGDNEVKSRHRTNPDLFGDSHFCVLNNGITAVAGDLSVTGYRFTLRDFQIVNGCQTSHILHKHRRVLRDAFRAIPFNCSR